MALAALLVTCLLASGGRALTFSNKGRYIPNIKIAEEIDIRDVTFTTPPTDSERSLTNANVNGIRSKPRVIVPVVTYHKVSHPPPELLGPPGESAGSYDAHPPDAYKGGKPKKYKFWQFPKSHGDYHRPGHHHKTGSKVILFPTKHRAAAFATKPARPVYYLVGDDASQNENDDHASDLSSGKYAEMLYNEKDLQFLKPSKNTYPKKYSPSSLKKHNHKMKPDSEGYGAPTGDEPLAPDHSETSHTLGYGAEDMPSNGGDRVEFQMYGMNGPNSYKFGYDTGKGDNRHFRFEERDSDGRIRGHYGYMDNEGKMRIMKYEADPETGFHAGPVDYPPEEADS